MTTLRMPDLGTVEGTVTLVRWLKREGDRITLGEPLFEVETDKGVSEVESAAEGRLVACLVAEGAAVASGDPIATIEGSAAASPALSPGPSAPEPAATAPRREPTPVPIPTGPATTRGTARTLLALARKHGVDFAAVKGSGPGGAVTRRDILQARGSSAGPAGSGGRAGSRGDEGLGALQSVVAARVSQSHREKVVYHVTMRVDMTRTLAARGSRSFTAFFVKACAMALSEMPVFRSWMAGAQVRSHESLDIAVAVGAGDDLYAPVVRRPASRSVQDISTEIAALAARARSRSLEAADSQGGCLLVSNLGSYPVDSFDAVILPEHSAALAVGSAIPTPVAVEGAVRITSLAALTLSVDHRLINGGAAARFLTRVKQLLEEGVE